MRAKRLPDTRPKPARGEIRGEGSRARIYAPGHPLAATTGIWKGWASHHRFLAYEATGGIATCSQGKLRLTDWADVRVTAIDGRLYVLCEHHSRVAAFARTYAARSPELAKALSGLYRTPCEPPVRASAPLSASPQVGGRPNRTEVVNRPAVGPIEENDG